MSFHIVIFLHSLFVRLPLCHRHTDIGLHQVLHVFTIRRKIPYTLRTPNSERATQYTFITYSYTTLKLYVSEFLD